MTAIIATPDSGVKSTPAPDFWNSILDLFRIDYINLIVDRFFILNKNISRASTIRSFGREKGRNRLDFRDLVGKLFPKTEVNRPSEENRLIPRLLIGRAPKLPPPKVWPFSALGQKRPDTSAFRRLWMRPEDHRTDFLPLCNFLADQ